VEHSSENADALVRAVRSATAEPLVGFVDSLIKQQYALSYICQLAQHALAFERWCEDRRISFDALTPLSRGITGRIYAFRSVKGVTTVPKGRLPTSSNRLCDVPKPRMKNN
jgi:hypothetical protein